jgi:hypothetical protein
LASRFRPSACILYWPSGRRNRQPWRGDGAAAASPRLRAALPPFTPNLPLAHPRAAHARLRCPSQPAACLHYTRTHWAHPPLPSPFHPPSPFRRPPMWRHPHVEY